MDPTHGGPIGYKPFIDATGERDGSYLIYSFGDDGIDNGGIGEYDPRARQPFRVTPGSDVPLNQHER